MRSKHQRIAALEALLAHPVFHDLADDAALGVPEDQPRAGQLLNAEQVKLLAQQAMIAARRLFKPRKVRVEIFFREKCRAVNALQLRILLVAEPVRAGQRKHFERLHAARRRHMRPPAKIHEAAIAIEAHLGTRFGKFAHEVRLHEFAVAAELLERLFTSLVLADERLVSRHHLGHLQFNRRQVFRSEGLLAVKVVEKTGVGGRAVAQLGLRK